MTIDYTDAYGWSSVAETHEGKVRKLNEDAVLSRPEAGLWVVADGMGGHEAGDRASQTVVASLEHLPLLDSLDGSIDALKHQLQVVNAKLWSEAQSNGGNISGSTVVALLARGGRGAVIWAGDSRAYRLRDGQLEQLTRDHSQVEEWIQNKLIERVQAQNHPASNVITRAIGADRLVELEIRTIEVLPGDTYLLCSDGLHGELSETDMALALAGPDARQLAKQLLTSALSGKARDNISLIVARVESGEFDTTKTVINPAVLNRGN